ncbi:MAG: hypothetical protein AAB152_12020 [Candidatus Coatesbacteria bacterium]
MSKELLRTRAALKNQWLAANRRALELHRRAAEADKEAAAMQRALDALEKAAPNLSEADVVRAPRTAASATALRLTEELKARGPMTAPQLAEATGISYWTVNAALRKGPFQDAGTVKNGHRTSQLWKVAEAGAGAESEVAIGEEARER